MSGEKDLYRLIRGMKPRLNQGEYVFCSVDSGTGINPEDCIGTFREAEGTTIILSRQKADELGLTYDYVAAWITLEIHSALEAVGLTAAFSNALAQHDISCNVMAGYYHDHIFVDINDSQKAMEALNKLAVG